MTGKVTIIFNDDGCDSYTLGGREIALDNSVKGTVSDVESALVEEGFKVSVLPLTPDKNDSLGAFVAGLKASAGSMVFNLCEGAFGKSALEMHIAALLELYGARFTGSGPLALGLSLNKGLTKDILSGSGITTPEYAVMNEIPARLKKNLKFPLIVKPLREDASIGIDSGAVVKTMKELKKRVDFIIEKYLQPAIVEEYVDGREFNIAVMGNGRSVRALPPSEIEFVDYPEGVPRICCYEAKWVEESPFYNKTVPRCPADIPEGLTAELQSVAVRAYGAIGCRDYARVDVRVGTDGNIKVLEVNPNPDISADAGFARAGKASGLAYPRLISEIVKTAFERYSLEDKRDKDAAHC